LITAAPSADDLEVGMQQKWHVETYYSCVTRGSDTHCGWHEPVLPGGTEIAGARALERSGGAIVAGCVIAGFG
ncbi:hypothetical protein BJ878DRAFT_402245, partial [Calycina marina]